MSAAAALALYSTLDVEFGVFTMFKPNLHILERRYLPVRHVSLDDAHFAKVSVIDSNTGSIRL